MAALKSDKGRLVLDFVWQGVRCREYLGLDDTKDGRAAARHTKEIIEGEIEAGTLDYVARFPKSKKARTVFAPPPPPPLPAGPPAFGTFAPEFLERPSSMRCTSLAGTHCWTRPDQIGERSEPRQARRTVLTQERLTCPAVRTETHAESECHRSEASSGTKRM